MSVDTNAGFVPACVLDEGGPPPFLFPFWGGVIGRDSEHGVDGGVDGKWLWVTLFIF